MHGFMNIIFFFIFGPHRVPYSQMNVISKEKKNLSADAQSYRSKVWNNRNIKIYVIT